MLANKSTIYMYVGYSMVPLIPKDRDLGMSLV